MPHLSRFLLLLTTKRFKWNLGRFDPVWYLGESSGEIQPLTIQGPLPHSFLTYDFCFSLGKDEERKEKCAHFITYY